MADRIVMRSVRGAAIKSRRLIFHFLGEFTRRVDAERSVEPNRPPCHKSFDVLTADQGQKIAKLLAVQLKQQIAMIDLLERHFVVHFRGLRVSTPKPVRERAINAAVLVLIGYGERKNFLLIEIGESFQVPSPGTVRIRRRGYDILELF